MNDFILSPGEPNPVALVNQISNSPYLIICEHASNRIPKSLNQLGLVPSDLNRHIALDIGALEVSKKLADQIGATLIYQNYSRLVIDCNRTLKNDTLIAAESDRTTIPGNLNLTPESGASRIEEIWKPFQDATLRIIQERGKMNRKTLLLCIHSFTPSMDGQERPWHIGFLYKKDSSMAKAFCEYLLDLNPNLNIGMNEPYTIIDDEDYSIPKYGGKMNLPHILVEIRQDLIGDSRGQSQWADYLAKACSCFLSEYVGL